MGLAKGEIDMARLFGRALVAGRTFDVRIAVAGLAIASGVELLILRTLTRTAIHIPALQNLQGPYELLTNFGHYAYYVAVTLLIPVLALLAFQVRNRGSAAIFAIFLFLAVSAAALASDMDRVILDSTSVLAVGILAATLVMRAGISKRTIPLLGFGTAFLFSGVYTATPDLTRVGVSLSQSAHLLDGAELFGLLFAISSPLLVGRNEGRSAKIAAFIIGGIALLFFLGNGSTSRFLLLWNVGLSGTLPGLFYAVAAGALAWTIVALYRSDRALEATGLLLLVIGGIGLHSTYQSGLVIAGLATLLIGLAERVPAAKPLPVQAPEASTRLEPVRL